MRYLDKLIGGLLILGIYRLLRPRGFVYNIWQDRLLNKRLTPREMLGITRQPSPWLLLSIVWLVYWELQVQLGDYLVNKRLKNSIYLIFILLKISVSSLLLLSFLHFFFANYSLCFLQQRNHYGKEVLNGFMEKRGLVGKKGGV